jgi:transposase
MLPNRLKSSLEAWFDDLGPEERANIEQVAMDLWEPYRLAVQAKLPQADIVADRFHIMQNLNKVIHKARRAIQRQAPEEVKDQLKGLRWTLVKNESSLKDQEREHLAQLKICYPQMYQLYCLRQDFHCLFEDHTDSQAAEDALEDWIRQAEELDVKPLQTFIATLRNWWRPILNFFKERVTSGFVEGINNKIKLIKRITFGMPNFEHFRLRVLFEFG